MCDCSSCTCSNCKDLTEIKNILKNSSNDTDIDASVLRILKKIKNSIKNPDNTSDKDIITLLTTINSNLEQNTTAINNMTDILRTYINNRPKCNLLF
jgi:tRNA(Phe) wybutosine-synthesizing methylase Tyw3